MISNKLFGKHEVATGRDGLPLIGLFSVTRKHLSVIQLFVGAIFGKLQAKLVETIIRLIDAV